MPPYLPTAALITSRDPAGNQTASDITALATGGYVVTWADTPTSGSSSTHARVYGATGKPTSGDILIGPGDQSSVTALPSGGFAVALLRPASDSNPQASLNVRLFGADGAPRAGATTLNAQPDASDLLPRLPTITALSDGRLLVAWATGWGPTGSRLVGSILSPDGAVLTGPLQLSSTISYDTGGFTDLAVSPLGDGGFTLASVGQTASLLGLSGSYKYGLAGVQIFDRDGKSKTQLITLSNGQITPISATTLPDNQVAIAYRSSQSIYADQFVFRTISSFGTLTDERAIGPGGLSGFNFSRRPVGDINLSVAADGNILANYDRYAGEYSGGLLLNSEVSELFSPDGQMLGLVSASNPAGAPNGTGNTINSQLSAALLNGSVALVQTSYSSGQSDVLTRTYQLAAVTSDPDGMPLVNDAFYKNRYPDVAAAGVDPDVHYDQYGWKEGRNPDELFDTNAYRFANPDVAAANINPLAHYDQSGWREGRDPAAGFDNELYLARNPDVRAAGIDPLFHYLQYGRAEGREISSAIGSASSIIHGSFDAEYYLLSNPDVGRSVQASRTVADAAEAAYRHYETYGWREGRSPNALFDVAGYLNAYTDVKGAGVDPLLHYDTYGWKEGRDPSGLFDTTNYLAGNGDVRTAGANPLGHFLQFGALEGRAPLGDGTFE
ncbi:hypothetical protein [Methylobacterium sp. A54F]